MELGYRIDRGLGNPLKAAAGLVATALLGTAYWMSARLGRKVDSVIAATTPLGEVQSAWLNLDANKDGFISLAELDMHRLGLEFEYPGVVDKFWSALAVADVNKDRRLSRAEFDVLLKDLSAWPTDLNSPLFATMDSAAAPFDRASKASFQALAGKVSAIKAASREKASVLASSSSAGSGAPIPKEGVNSVVIRPGPPGPAAALLPLALKSAEQAKCLFSYPGGPALPDGAESVEEAWVYGAIAGASGGAPGQEVRVGPDGGAVGAAAAEYICQRSAEAIAARGSFHVAFSGGSMPKLVASGLATARGKCDFSKWQVYFSDERCVPLTDADSNYKSFKSEILDMLPEIRQENVLTIDPSLVNEPARAAEVYEEAVRQRLASNTNAQGIPSLDLVLLGMGEDGHTCSLFPNHPLLKESSKLIAPILDSPKPPPARITFTLPLVRAARHRAFIATGAGKAAVLVDILDRAGSALPCAQVGSAVWFVDQSAAAQLTRVGPAALAKPTGKESDVLVGQLGCYGAWNFYSDKLAQADMSAGYNAAQRDVGLTRRGPVKAVIRDGSSREAEWYFTGKPGEAGARTNFQVVDMYHGSTPNTNVRVQLNGATITSWQVRGQEMLFVSEKAVLNQLGKAIRGGIPLVFPQFGPGAIQQHGFARNVLWTQEGDVQTVGNGDVTATFSLVPGNNEYITNMWSYKFKLVYKVVLKADELECRLVVTNTDSRPFEFTSLLHSYFRVKDIKSMSVSGLQGVQYLDKTDGGKIKTQTDALVKVSAETDSVFQSVPITNDVLLDTARGYSIHLKRSGFNDVVLWNPYIEASKKMAAGDFVATEYNDFMCVEAGTVSQSVTLQPGQTWEGKQDLVRQASPQGGSSATVASSGRQVAMFGCTGGTGFATLKRLVQMGDKVKCLLRDPKRLPSEWATHPLVELVTGDATDKTLVEQTVKGADMVVVALGGNSTNVKVCSAAQPVINAAVNKFCPDARMVVVTSMGVGSSYQYCNMVTKAVVNTVLRAAIKDKCLQEETVEKEIKNFVFVRPGGLLNKPGTGVYQADEKVPGGTIAREDVADFIVKKALGTDEYLNQGVTVCY